MNRKKILEKYKKDKILSHANLRSANLRSANLSFANLSFANLSFANLNSANLSSANLYSANLSFANLRSANLSFANLNSADLSFANLRSAINIPPQHHCSLNILKYQKGKLRAFKYLNGNKSPYHNYEYEIGKTYTFKNCDINERILCGIGGNVATLEWCLRDTNNDITKTYIIVEFDVKDIVAIPYNSDGKFRVKKFRIVRKLNKKELEKAIEPLYQNS